MCIDRCFLRSIDVQSRATFPTSKRDMLLHILVVLKQTTFEHDLKNDSWRHWLHCHGRAVCSPGEYLYLRALHVSFFSAWYIRYWRRCDAKYNRQLMHGDAEGETDEKKNVQKVKVGLYRTLCCSTPAVVLSRRLPWQLWFTVSDRQRELSCHGNRRAQHNCRGCFDIGF